MFKNLLKETRRKKHEEKRTEKEKTAETPTSSPTRKRPSTIELLDYVVVSDSLSRLDAGVKGTAPDPDDTATLTQMMAKKQKILADKKHELDEQVALALSEKKLKVMGETVTPSESEVDLGVFAKKPGNLLQKTFENGSLFLFAASAKFTRSGAKINISNITPPTSPPPVSFDVSPPHSDPKGKGKEGAIEGDAVKKVTTPVSLGVMIQEGVHVEGVETDYESSEASPPRGTIYTKRNPSTSGGGGGNVSRQGPEIRKVDDGGEWMDYNPFCDDLPHVPRWALLQGSRMDDLENCHDFYSLSLPLLNGCFRKTRVADAEDNLTQEKQHNADRQRDWTAAYGRSKRELKSARDEVVKSEVVAAQKDVEEARTRIVELGKIVKDQQVQNKTLELLSEELGDDCKWLLTRNIPLIGDLLVKSDEHSKYVFELGGAAYDSGRKDGYTEGKAAVLAKEKDHQFELFKFLEFGILKAIEKLSRRGIAVETLKKVLQDTDVATDVHLVLTSLGGLQCLCYRYTETLFTYS
ncbi:hypothetical protein Hanom_Chr15g01393511 [Helianthus anomalus]